MSHTIHDLRHLSPPSESLLAQLRKGMTATELTGDGAYTYTKSLPTMLLYDEEGLILYEKITQEASSYYLYPLELAILSEHSAEIVGHLFPGSEPSTPERGGDDRETPKRSPPHQRRPPVGRWRVGDWGGDDVGRHNGGVNSEEGMDEGRVGRREGVKAQAEGGAGDKGRLEGVVLELGAGSLGKTSHLLKALAARPSAADGSVVSYLALDLDGNELHRTLDEVDATLGSTLAKGNVTTGGIWGTFDAGLEWCKEGGHLASTSSTLASEGSSVRSSSCDRKSDGDDASSTMSSSPPRIAAALPPSPPASYANPSHLHHAAPAAKQSTPSAADVADAPPTHFLFLGSSLGNFPRSAAPAFLKSLPLRPGSGDTLVLGLDHRNDPATIERAYNDAGGFTKRWAENMWRGVERLSGLETGKLGGDWEYEGRYNEKEGRHEAYFRAKRETQLRVPEGEGEKEVVVEFEEGELLNIEWSTKYSPSEASTLFADANLRPISHFTDPENLYSVWLLERPPFQFESPTPLSAQPSPTTDSALTFASPTAKGRGMPSVAEWETLWRFWDTITLGMISEADLHRKPIDLRHKSLFYVGHIPAFLDIFLSRHLAEPHTKPEYFKDLFERGIDPSVDDPTQIHAHSAVPEQDCDWPSLSEILAFRDRVRQRLLSVYDDVATGKRDLTRRLARILFMTYEHEAMHAETLLYMLLQSPTTLPPPGFAPPDFAHLATLWDAQHARDLASTSSTVTFGPMEIELGHHDLESEDAQAWEVDAHEFGWDNEHGRATGVQVGRMRMDRKGVTNGEYRTFLEGEGMGSALPGSWIEVDGEIKVKTLYGPIPFAQAQHWPLMASYDELAAFAKSKGGRLPTEPELRAWLDVVPEGDRVEWEGSNVGVKNWHPVPAQPSHLSPSGARIPGHNGGVWEWTSSPFAPLPESANSSFVTSELYPGYSTDFFDNQHMVVLGGSFATIPRLASRKTVRNFYQHNYPFAWVGGRVVYDA